MINYSERINPEETYGGSLNSHLKRYDFASPFCIAKNILDAACGAGYGSYYLSRQAKNIIGIDVSACAVAYAKARYQNDNLEFRIMDICRLDFPDKYFDVICAFEIVEHLDNPGEFILEAKRVLRSDGVLLISTPNVENTTYNNPNNPFHKIEFSRDDFREFLEKHFLDVQIFEQRRRQSQWHYWLQKADIFHLRSFLPSFLRKKICRGVGTASWEDADLGDFIIDKSVTKTALNLVSVCRLIRD